MRQAVQAKDLPSIFGKYRSVRNEHSSFNQRCFISVKESEASPSNPSKCQFEYVIVKEVGVVELVLVDHDNIVQPAGWIVKTFLGR